jgi:hypothetical protein
LPEPQTATFQDTLDAAVISIADRMRARPEPRKQRQRVKHREITEPESDNARAAWLFAIREGVGPNLFLTVHWKHAPAKIEGQHPVERNGLFRDGLKAWFYRHAPGQPFVWIEVREKTRALGEHVHLFVYVPEPLQTRFTLAAHRLVARQSATMTDTAFKVVQVGWKWWERLRYVMKGGNDAVRQRHGVPGKWSPYQGTIEGKRVRIAHSIGPTARKAAESAVGGVFNASASA